MAVKRNNFIERSILGALSFFKDSIFSEEYALKGGFLQSIDPRVKLASFVLLLISTLLIRNSFLLLILYFAVILLAHISEIKPGFFLKRTWVFIPIFSLFIAIPAIFNTFTPGETLFSIKLSGLQLNISRPGFFGAILFVVRVLVSVSLAVLLSLVTKQSELLSVLRIFRIPQIFVMTINMCYRYIYLFVEIVENTYLAIKSRIGTAVPYKRGQRIVAWSIAGLWQRSRVLNEEVYKAMLSRGYSGEPRILNEFRTNPRDWVWLFSVTAISILLVYLDHLIKT